MRNHNASKRLKRAHRDSRSKLSLKAFVDQEIAKGSHLSTYARDWYLAKKGK